MNNGKQVKFILVGSPFIEDGGSTVTANLAQVLVKKRKRVWVIDEQLFMHSRSGLLSIFSDIPTMTVFGKFVFGLDSVNDHLVDIDGFHYLALPDLRLPKPYLEHLSVDTDPSIIVTKIARAASQSGVDYIIVNMRGLDLGKGESFSYLLLDYVAKRNLAQQSSVSLVAIQSQSTPDDQIKNTLFNLFGTSLVANMVYLPIYVLTNKGNEQEKILNDGVHTVPYLNKPLNARGQFNAAKLLSKIIKGFRANEATLRSLERSLGYIIERGEW